MKKLYSISALFLLLFTNFRTISIPKVAELNSEIGDTYIVLALDLTKADPDFTPPVAARSFGYITLTMYEAVVTGSKNYKSLQGQIDGFLIGTIKPPTEDVQWECVLSAATSTVMKYLFRGKPLLSPKIDSTDQGVRRKLEKKYNRKTLEASTIYGFKVGNAIISYSKTDGADKGYNNNFANHKNGYNPSNGDWRPTPPAFKPVPLQPFWGKTRTFFAKNASLTLPIPPPEYSETPNSLFFETVKAVYDKSRNLSVEEKQIAEYWADGVGSYTPGGHFLNIVNQVVRKEKLNLAQAVEIYCKCGLAISDSFVSCWAAKFEFNVLRPVTSIQKLIDYKWLPYLETPPFPEYPSGHSVCSGAVATILTGYFGSDFVFSDWTNPIPRSYRSFMEAAEEASISRFYGGIHFQTGCRYGLIQGCEVARNIQKIKFRKNENVQ